MQLNENNQTPVERVRADEPGREFPMDEGSLFDDSQWDIGFDEETGKIRLDGVQGNTEPPPTRQGISEDASAQPSGALQQNHGDNSPAEARIVKLENAVQQLIGVMTGMVSAGMNGNSQGQQQAEQPQYDLQDSGQLSQYITNSINTALKPVLDILPKIVNRIEYQDTRSKYGKEFDDSLALINELTAGGALTPEKAFEFIKKVRGNGQSATTHGANHQPVQRQQGTAETLISKVNRVQTQTGINGSVSNQQRRIDSVRDAFEAALESLS